MIKNNILQIVFCILLFRKSIYVFDLLIRNTSNFVDLIFKVICFIEKRKRKKPESRTLRNKLSSDANNFYLTVIC